MPVIMKGGSSGNRENHLPPVPDRGYAQPVMDTSTRGAYSSNVFFSSENPKTNHAQNAIADFLPTGGKCDDCGTDTNQQDIS